MAGNHVLDSLVRRGGVALVAVSLLGIGCWSEPAGAAGARKGTLVEATFAPFSGATAFLGQVGLAAGIIGLVGLNADGGVLGHDFTWIKEDTRGDPADAVPVARKMVGTVKNLILVNGNDSTSAPPTVPIINAAHKTMFLGAGQAIYTKSSYKYIWRNTPPDAADGVAMAYYVVHDLHCKSAATIYGQTVAAEGSAPGSIKAFEDLGGKIVAKEAIAATQPSYETEANQIATAHPCAIMTEENPATAATIFSELNTLGGLTHIVGTDATIFPTWFDAVEKAIGSSVFERDYVGVEFGVGIAKKTPSYPIFRADVLKAKKYLPTKTSVYLNTPYAMATWDWTNEVALAMLEVNSVDPKKFNTRILTVTQKQPGAVVVHTFVKGKAALAAGKKIQYVGVLGPSPYNKYHNFTGSFEVQRASGKEVAYISGIKLAPVMRRVG